MLPETGLPERNVDRTAHPLAVRRTVAGEPDRLRVVLLYFGQLCPEIRTVRKGAGIENDQFVFCAGRFDMCEYRVLVF